MAQRRPSNGQLSSHLCGMSNWHPAWLQRYATTKTFMMVYGLLGTIQATSYMYFVVTLTTLEKRFKIPSQTTGIILSGNEISQIMLSLILSYVGGQRNRPRWIAWGIVFCGLSCYILALPHFIYGGGEDVMRLTEEYMSGDAAMDLTSNGSSLVMQNSTLLKQNQQLCGATKEADECDALLSIVPLVLIFLSQFVLGVGNTLYYSLGQTYLDDNSKKTNTPLMLALAMSLRMIGPVFGFLLGYLSLNMFIVPGAKPLIDNKDPRWLGAWWFGWMILGTLMVLFSGLIGLFPKQLPKRKPSLRNSHVPHVLRHEMLQYEERRDSSGMNMLPLGSAFSSMTGGLDAVPPAAAQDLPKLKDFPKALMRLLRNKLLIFNIISAIFYILGAAGYMTFLTKYMEVQFHKSAQSATIVVGPVSIIGMVVGLIGSGLVISKKKPPPSAVLMWNVIVGFIYILGQVSYMFLYCGDSGSMLTDGKLNITAQCNSNCGCDGVPYSPVCHASSGVTYFSPCHAGCYAWNSTEKVYSNCSCLATDVFTTTMPSTTTPWRSTSLDSEVRQVSSLAVANILPHAINRLSTSTLNLPTTTTTSTTTPTTTTKTTTIEIPTTPPTTKLWTTTESTTAPSTTTATTATTATTTTTTPTTTTTITTDSTPSITTSTTLASVHVEHSVSGVEAAISQTTNGDAEEHIDEIDEDAIKEEKEAALTRSTSIDGELWRRRRDAATTTPSSIFGEILQPGVCLEGCTRVFWIFSIAAMVINWFGSSGRIGNILVNYRSVSAQDKSFAQGLSLMMISLFALIPGPILFGRIIDSTCLVWTKTCNGRDGNCQLYDQETFRYMVNITAMCLTILGIIFDFLVWYYGRDLDLYGDAEIRLEQTITKRKNQPLTPLLSTN